MMRARANSLRLGWRNFGSEEDRRCQLCRAEVETLEHFLIDCNELQEARSRHLILQRPQIQSRENIIDKILLFETQGGETECHISIVAQLWALRKSLICKQRNM